MAGSFNIILNPIKGIEYDLCDDSLENFRSLSVIEEMALGM